MSIEVTVMLIAIPIGYAAGIGFGLIAVGTVVTSLIVGPLINFFNSIFKKILRIKKVT